MWVNLPAIALARMLAEMPSPRRSMSIAFMSTLPDNNDFDFDYATASQIQQWPTWAAYCGYWASDTFHAHAVSRAQNGAQQDSRSTAPGAYQQAKSSNLTACPESTAQLAETVDRDSRWTLLVQPGVAEEAAAEAAVVRERAAQEASQVDSNPNPTSTPSPQPWP
jgi:hypothetical protein